MHLKKTVFSVHKKMYSLRIVCGFLPLRFYAPIPLQNVFTENAFSLRNLTQKVHDYDLDFKWQKKTKYGFAVIFSIEF